MRFAELDAVTLDAYGTLVELADPVPALTEGLQARAIERDTAAVAAAFAAETAYYRDRSFEGRDDESLALLRQNCAGIFLGALECDLDPSEFVDTFVASLRFRLIGGALEALRSFRRRGLALAVVSNWDIALPEHLAALGLSDLPIFTSAHVGAPKPDPALFRHAVRELGVQPERVLHIGDDPADELGAQAAGLRFASAPLGAAA